MAGDGHWELNGEPWLQGYLRDALGPGLHAWTHAPSEAAQPAVHMMSTYVMVSHEMATDSGLHRCDPTCPQWTPPPPPLTRRQRWAAKFRATRRRAWWTVRHLHEYRFVHISELEREDDE